jgi:hypothetical protein
MARLRAECEARLEAQRRAHAQEMSRRGDASGWSHHRFRIRGTEYVSESVKWVSGGTNRRRDRALGDVGELGKVQAQLATQQRVAAALLADSRSQRAEVPPKWQGCDAFGVFWPSLPQKSGVSHSSFRNAVRKTSNAS